MKLTPVHDKPMAVEGFTSYRIRGTYGYIMIGARDDDEAWREAQRSSKYLDRTRLEVWNGQAYELVSPSNES